MKDEDIRWILDLVYSQVKLHRDYDSHEYGKVQPHNHCAECGKIYEWNAWYPTYKWNGKLCRDCNIRHEGPLKK